MASHVVNVVYVFKHHKSKSVLTVQKRFHVEFGRELPTKMYTYRWYNLFSGAGYISKRKTLGKQLISEAKLHEVKWPLLAVQKNKNKWPDNKAWRVEQYRKL
jgi:hypothetical protein